MEWLIGTKLFQYISGHIRLLELMYIHFYVLMYVADVKTHIFLNPIFFKTHFKKFFSAVAAKTNISDLWYQNAFFL